jgi:hypothetical protein
MVIKILKNLTIPRPSKMYPYWDFWFENKPSGNPGQKFPPLVAKPTSGEWTD